MNENNALSLIPDTPNENAFKEYVQPLAEFILNSEPRLTIGVFGGWGVGKTSFLKSLEAELRSKDNVIVVFFNAWRYELEKTHATIPLLKSIYFAFDEYYKKNPSTSGERIKEALKTLIQHFNVRFYLPLGLAHVEASIDRDEYEISKLTSLFDDNTLYYDAVKYLELAIRKLRDEVKDFRVVILVDDLDRCSPKKAVEVLESIKVLLDIDGFIYVMALNYTVMEKLLTKYYDQYKFDDGFSEDYFSKFFQVIINIPEWDGNMIKRGPLSILTNNTPLKEPHIERIIKALEPKLTPREAKRFVNTFIVRLKMAESLLKKENVNISEIMLSELILDLCILDSNPLWAGILRLIERYGEEEFKVLQNLITNKNEIQQEDFDKILSSEIGQYLIRTGLIKLPEDYESYEDIVYSSFFERLVEILSHSLLFSDDISYSTIKTVLKIRSFRGDIKQSYHSIDLNEEDVFEKAPATQQDLENEDIILRIKKVDSQLKQYRYLTPDLDDPIQIACLERMSKILSIFRYRLFIPPISFRRRYPESTREQYKTIVSEILSGYKESIFYILETIETVLLKMTSGEPVTIQDFNQLNELYKKTQDLRKQIEFEIDTRVTFLNLQTKPEGREGDRK